MTRVHARTKARPRDLFMATSTVAPVSLEIGNWLVGLVVLTLGVFLPLASIWRKLFGGASGSKRSQ